MKIGLLSAIGVLSSSALVFGGTELDKPKTTGILIHEHLSDACELVQSGQLLQYRDYSAVVVDGTPGELYSPELAPGSFIEPSNGAGREIKSASKAGFVVKGSEISTPADLPRVVAIVRGTDCPTVTDAVGLAAKQHDNRKAVIQAKLYRPDFDHVTRPMPATSPRDEHPAMNAVPKLPPGKPKVKHGTVVLDVAIGPDGAVKDTTVVRSLDPLLDKTAVEEVQTWRFQPGRKQGLPVAVLIKVEVNFDLH